MKEIKRIIDIYNYKYPYERFEDLDKYLFVDIETTGFRADSSYLYMIGCAYYEAGSFYSLQWFAENHEEEEAVLYSFYNFAIKYKMLVHFNGNRFDIPYLQEKTEELELPFNFANMEGIDIFKRLQPYRNFLKLPNLKQKTVESLMGIERIEKYDAGQLIKIYENYVEEPSEELLSLLIEHNYLDLAGMVGILPILAIPDIFNKSIKVTRAGKNPYRDAEGNDRSEVIMEIALPTSLPIPVSYGYTDCYFTGEDMKGKLRVTMEEGELKYFHPDYKEYYYIPAEDAAVHKTVASFVDASYREPAKASNCYTRKKGTFLPQWDNLFSPAYKKEYADKTTYFEMTDEFKRSSDSFTKYARHILEVLADS